MFQYRLDKNGQLITARGPASNISLGAGTGPRHLAFHPHLPFAYLISELANTVTRMNLDRESGLLSSCVNTDESPCIQSTLLNPNLDAEFMAAAEIVISNNGNYIYCSNRDTSDQHRSSIVVFKITNNTTGAFSLMQTVSSHGQHPRHFALTCNDTILIVANKDSNNVVAFDVNSATGLIDAKSFAITESLFIVSPSFVLVV